MIVTKVESDLLTLEKGILVHGCNCMGIMGGGIAWSIREKWPGVFAAYSNHEAAVGLHLGDIVAVSKHGVVTQTDSEGKIFTADTEYRDNNLPPELIVVNAMTQFNFGGNTDVIYVDYDAISACFARVKILARQSGLAVHFPLIGCGLANGDWEEVSNRIEQALGPDIKTQLWLLPPTSK
jgi:O-acetyl-ADP-ribose deacetylase (regulator of RNase III)